MQKLKDKALSDEASDASDNEESSIVESESENSSDTGDYGELDSEDESKTDDKRFSEKDPLSLDDMEEFASEQQGSNNLKRSASDPSSGAKPAKIRKGAKFTKKGSNKPPTKEELEILKETDITFYTSLFQLQIKELLSEVTIKDKWQKKSTDFVKKLTNKILGMSPTKPHQIYEHKWLTDLGVEVPIIQEPQHVKGSFHFLPPIDVFTAGGYLASVLVKPDAHIDLAVVMPKGCIHSLDYLNQQYLRKRALYLGYIAANLKEWEEQSCVQFMYHHNNHMKPILEVKPNGKLGSQITIRIHAVPENDQFKLQRFHLGLNNVRKQWYLQSKNLTEKKKKGTTEEDEREPCVPTPFYNCTMLEDLTMKLNADYIQKHLANASNVSEGICLLKVWLNQRQLDKGFGSFTGFIMTMYVIYLLEKNIFANQMNSFQIFRSTLYNLSKVNWAEEGITLCEQTPDKQKPSLEEFHKAFSVVFVDYSGYNNLCASMAKVTLERAKHEADLSLEYINSKGVDVFDVLFMKPVLFTRKFDQVFHVSQLVNLKRMYELPDLGLKRERLIDYSGDYVHSCIETLLDIIYQTFGRRIQMLDIRLTLPKRWSIDKPPPTCCSNEEKLVFGVIVNIDTYTSVLDKGPAADADSEANKFRKFWGDLSELRRFQDGTICEAVLWKECESVADKRKILVIALKKMLFRHCLINPSSVTAVVDQLDKLLKTPSQIHFKSKEKITSSIGTGEEQHLDIIRSLEELCKNIKNVSDLPLRINSIQGISPVFRYCETFPATKPLPGEVVQINERHHAKYPFGARPAPQLVPAMSVLCILEGSGKWPDDVEAMRRIKAAYILELSSKIEQIYHLVNKVTPNYLDVFKNGFVFRIKIECLREITVAKMWTTPEGMIKSEDTPQSRALERELVALPIVTSTLHGIQQQNVSFCNTVRLAKRWVASHMMLGNHIPDIAIELIVTHLYLNPAPFKAPNSSLSGFLRFLHFMSTWDWKLHPLVIDLNDKFSKEDYNEIQTIFSRDRSTLPLMFISTPYDRKSQMWTKDNPKALVLNRLVLLARESLHILEKQLDDPSVAVDFYHIFRPPLDVYDVLIHLDSNQISRRHQQIGVSVQDAGMRVDFNFKDDKGKNMPVVDYEPVQYYLQELRDAYSELAVFFYDIYGGTVIALLWRPKISEPKIFTASNIKAHLPKSTGKEVQLVPNFKAIIEDFEIIGKGIVTKVEVKRNLTDIR